ncbi:hypothetical protein ABZ853_22380 [Streptomyces albidoflavus]
MGAEPGPHHGGGDRTGGRPRAVGRQVGVEPEPLAGVRGGTRLQVDQPGHRLGQW